MEITKEQVLEFLTTNQEVITEVLQENHVENYLKSENGKKLLQPQLDKYFNKGLESWKANNLDKLVDEEITKRYPEETPEMRKIKELETKLAEKEREAVRKDLTVKAQQLAAERGIPTDLATYFVADNEDITVENIDKFNEAYKKALDGAIVERTKGATPRTPITPTHEVETKNMNFSDFAKVYGQKNTN